MRLLPKLTLIVITLTLLACGSSESGISSSDTYFRADQLKIKLNNISRLTIRGNEVYNNVASTIMGTTKPLFVIDDIQMGRSLARIESILDNNQIIKIKFLTSSRATTRYGEEGRNGVIIIKKKE